MSKATISALSDELLGLIKSVPAFANKGYSVYNEEDLEVQGKHQEYPIVGVMYDGAAPADSANEASGSDTKSSSSVLVESQFTVIIGIQYSYSGQDDAKETAFDLLDQTRGAVFGYIGVSRRPWRFVLERSEPKESVDGLVFYYQVWRTRSLKSGSSVS